MAETCLEDVEQFSTLNYNQNIYGLKELSTVRQERESVFEKSVIFLMADFCQAKINSGSLYIHIMFGRLFRPLWSKLTAPRTLLTTSAILGYTLLKTQLHLDSTITEYPGEVNQERNLYRDIEKYVRQLKKVDICQSSQLAQGDRIVHTVVDPDGLEHKIVIARLDGNLYAYLGSCPHREPFDAPNTDYSLKDAMIFHDKMYCPHHGCIFSIKNGSVQHGPSVNDLPIFKAEEKQGKVTLMYPSVIPISITPNMLQRDAEDLRKVVILGGDDGATVGCINGLRQFGFEGQITVVKEGPYNDPYRKEYLHKTLLNLHLNDSNSPNWKDSWVQQLNKEEKLQKTIEDAKEKVLKTLGQNQKKTLQTLKKNPKSERKKKKYNQTIDDYIEDQLQKQIYKKLQYYDEKWYQKYGVDFIFNNEAFRIINKQYYPYITFIDGTKIQYDALLISTGLVHKFPSIEGITIDEARDLNINLAQNVFSPIRSKEQHIKFNTFMNKHTIKSLLVMGYNVESLEFIYALKKEFPDVKVTVLDTEKDSQVSEHLGPEVEKAILKEYTSRDVDFFIKIRDQIFYSNKYSAKNLLKEKLGELPPKKKRENILKSIRGGKGKDKKEPESKEKSALDPLLKYENSITARLNDNFRIKADGVVFFPHNFSGNTHWVRNGKYTDFEYLHDQRLSADTFMRTDNIRIFAAGTGAITDYYLNQRRLTHTDTQISYEQGFNAAINMQALRIPFTYVPYKKFSFFNKDLYYIGTRDFFDRILTVGDVQSWDFLTIYALGNEVKAVSASPSKLKQMSIMRQCFRVNCVPCFQDLLNGYWSIQNLVNLLKKLDKSGCYKEHIFKNRDHIHKKDLIWMQRSADAGYENDRPLSNDDFPSAEVGADGNLKEL